MAGGKGTRTDAVHGTSNVLCWFYGAGINKNLRETLTLREPETERENKRKKKIYGKSKENCCFFWSE